MTAPAYLDWLYDAACFKASHNSYDGPNGKPQNPAKWDFDAQYKAGCRGFELDLYQCDPQSFDTGCEWSVSHTGIALGKHCWPLSEYLKYLRAWSGKHDPPHDPVFIVLDLKSVRQPYATFAEDLDSYLHKVMDGLLFSPADLLQHGAPDLVRAVRDPAHGWPAIGELMGKFMFCLSGTGTAARAAYAGYKPDQRLCFADMDRPEDAARTQETVPSGHQVVINVRADQLFWGKLWLKNNPGFLLRVYGLTSGDWKDALGKGANILATDHVKTLRVGKEPFARGDRTRAG